MTAPDPFLDLAEQNIRKLNAERARRRGAEWQATNRLWRAIMLSPTLEICAALLLGQHVPHSRLDPEWAARFGIRDTADQEVA